MTRMRFHPVAPRGLPGDGFDTSMADIDLFAVHDGFETIGRRTVVTPLPRKARWRAGKPA